MTSFLPAYAGFLMRSEVEALKMLLDEPEQRLDAHRLELVISAIRARADAGAAVVLATHHPRLLEALAGFGTPVAISVVMLMALGFPIFVVDYLGDAFALWPTGALPDAAAVADARCRRTSRAWPW